VRALGQPFIDLGWVLDHWAEIQARTLEHVKLTVLAVAIGLAISLPIAIYAHRHHRAYGPITSFAGLLYTIPSLSLFVILLPITHISDLTVEIALVSYTLLILIRNIVAGLNGVPADAKEAAQGMGYTDAQLLWKVELPLALPVIMAGVRIATVSTIGLITIAALIGKGGLGQFILEGLRTFFTTETMTGAILSVILALLADGVLLGATRLLTPWTRASRAREAV
jgi:osmoprotectant transport system permease protein